MIILTIIVFILILGLLVFVHELGHFVMAKRAGMRVEEFGFGFPPRIFKIRKGETRYSLNWIPLGGFVKITGEDGGLSDDPRAFVNKGFGKRFSVLVAGVVMNFLLAWFLMFLGFWLIGTPSEITADFNFSRAKVAEPQISVIAVQEQTPAAAAGFRTGDVILSMDNKKFESIEEMISYTKEKAGSPVVYELKRGKEILTRQVTPRPNPPEGSGPVGFAPAKIAMVKYPVWQALALSFRAFFGKTLGILAAFGYLLKSLFVTGHLVQGISGPVGIAILTRDFTALGFAYLVQFTAVLSLNLAIINGIPFPALDGGRLLFLLIEKIRGAKSLKWERLANTVGFLLLILLMIAVTVGDFEKYSQQFKIFFGKVF
jgi:regulator of sigma E protease